MFKKRTPKQGAFLILIDTFLSEFFSFYVILFSFGVIRNNKKGGVILSSISPSMGVQASMFDEIDRDKHGKLMKALDELSAKDGRNTVVIASQGFDPSSLGRHHLSRQYTTRWEDIIEVETR